MRALFLRLGCVVLISGQGCPSVDIFTGGGDNDGADGDVDVCGANGWYGDGVCDPDCLYLDPDCDWGDIDVCEANGWYGDGICDPYCELPDPDCE